MCKKQPKGIKMTPIHLLINQGNKRVLKYLINKNKDYLAPESPRALRWAKKSFDRILSNRSNSQMSLSSVQKGIDFSKLYGDDKMPTLHLLYK